MADASSVDLIESLAAVATRASGRDALRFPWARGGPCAIPWAELPARITATGDALVRTGLRSGERVVLALDVGPAAVLGHLGAIDAGLVPCLFPPFEGGAGGGARWVERLRDAVETIDARRVVVDDAFVEAVCAAGLPAVGERAIEATDAAARGTGRRERSRLCALQLTSGSTGRPRAVRVTHRNVLSNAASVRRRIGATPEDVMVSWAPLHHDMGLQGALWNVLLFGGTTCLMPPRRFTRRPLAWLEAVSRERATLTLGPSFAYALTARALERRSEDDALDLAPLRMIFNGAEPIDPGAVDRFLDRTARYGLDPGAMMPCYGLGEATLAVSLTPPGAGMRVESGRVSCGPVLDDVGVEVVGVTSDGPAGDGEVGEIVVSGPSVCDGYDDRGRRFDGATFDGGRVRTGDLGRIEAGELYVVGREKDVLIVRGTKVAAADLEREAEGVEGVRPGGAVAFAVPDPEQGTERAVVLIRVDAARRAEPSVVERAVAARLVDAAGVACEVRRASSADMPKTTSGKPRRGAARARYLEAARA